ncbi:MAG: hypothetical protein HY305_07690, partial [Sphingobacteriales bacterium]|nr:hypothetical protein [Sphingobacteriales bacterium]
FGLGVGALFAVVGNKYIIDSSLPESTTYTLVDTLHGLTLLFIFAVITTSVYSLKLIKNNQVDKANRFDRVMAMGLLLLYLGLNAYYIYQANWGN